MIKVERTGCPDQLNPAMHNQIGPTELRKVTDKMARGEKLLGDDFRAYRHPDVREALREMSFGKCVYCESKIAGSQDTDVEHYRPKKGVTEADKAGIAHEGYWWLAMVWENLVLSCMHCNQMRSTLVIIPDDLETEEEFREFLMRAPESRAGKKNAFPTQGNVWVTTPDGDLSDEKPLILNPVDDTPEDHLEWVLFKGASTVRARNNSPEGEATRSILGLNRRWLEEDRRIHLLEMREDRNDIIAAINNWIEVEDEDARRRFKATADRAIARLMEKKKPHRPFAGMASAFVKLVQGEVAQMMQPPVEG